MDFSYIKGKEVVFQLAHRVRGRGSSQEIVIEMGRPSEHQGNDVPAVPDDCGSEWQRRLL